jgi:hypothetical protein
MSAILIKRKPYYRKDGTYVKGATYRATDRGAKGRTPASKRWYRPSLHTGWKADMPQDRRRKLVLDAHGGELLASARSMQALSNVTVDKTTKREAGLDARYFFKRYKRGRII